MYTAHDINFTIVGYSWIAIWYTFAVFEMVYVKKVVDTVQMTTWSRTYYQVRLGTADTHQHTGDGPNTLFVTLCWSCMPCMVRDRGSWCVREGSLSLWHSCSGRPPPLCSSSSASPVSCGALS